MAIARPDFSCRHCGHCPTEQEIAKSHFTKKCPACGGVVELDAPGALTRSRGAALAGIAGMVVGVGAGFVALGAFGVNAKLLQGWSHYQRLSLGLAVIFGGVAIAFACQRAWVKIMLARVRKQMKADGKL